MSQCNSRADLHRRMAEVYDFCKGTKFEGKEWECVKYKGSLCTILTFCQPPELYEFALGIVEDKRVWEGDTLFTASGISFVATQGNVFEGCSWNPPAPPKPKTVSISVNGGEPVAWRWKYLFEDSDWHHSGSYPHSQANITIESLYANKEPITLDQMVDRFLGWKLPEHFNPDAGISFKPEYNIEYMAKQGKSPMRHEPTGTNLFDADQTRAMLLYLFEGKL